MPAGKALHANGVWSQAAWAQVLASSLTVTLALNNLFNLGVLHLSLNAVHIACGCQEIVGGICHWMPVAISLCLVRALKRTREIFTCDEHVVTGK